MSCGMIIMIYKNKNRVSTKKNDQKNKKFIKYTMLCNKNNIRKIKINYKYDVVGV